MGHECENPSSRFQNVEEMVQTFDLRSFERLLEGASGEVYSRENVGAKKGEMLFLDLCLFFGGERVSEGEVEVGFDEFLVGMGLEEENVESVLGVMICGRFGFSLE